MSRLPTERQNDNVNHLSQQQHCSEEELSSISIPSRETGSLPEQKVIDGSEQLKPFKLIEGLHTKVFESAVIQSVNPLHCISIRKLRSRSICLWGIRMIRQTILGQRNAHSYVRGFVSTGKFSVLVQIPDESRDMIVHHFMSEGKSREVAISLAKEGPWYHVVDGGHVHAALVELIEDFSENFSGFKWPVVVIKWSSSDTVRAISRMCHEMQRDAHLIDFTLPDTMQNLRDIIDTQCRRQGIVLAPGEKVRNGFIKEVMTVYSGRHGYADNTMRNICGIVVKLSSEVVQSIRLLLTEECDAYCQQLGERRPFGDDTRVYKKLLSSQSLKGVKQFLGGAMRDEDRVNVIHRLRFLAREREFYRSFSSAEVEKQCQNVIAVRKELLKFEEFLDEDSWPAGMDNLKQNMLQTTLLDRDISEHVEKSEKDLFPVLLDSFVKVTGMYRSQKLEMFKMRSKNDERDGNQRISNPNDAVDETNCVTTAMDAKGGHVAGLKTAKNSKLTGASTRNVEESLRESGIMVKRTSLLEFERNSSDLERSFDFMLADPYQKVPCPPSDHEQITAKHEDSLVDEKGIKIYLQCIRRLLVPGGHAFIFLNWRHILQWAMLATDCMFEKLGDPFVVIKDASKVQKVTMKGMQSLYELALVLRKPGKHPSGFTAVKKNTYEMLPNCRTSRWCNVIDGVPPPAERLTFKPTKVLVRPNEKPFSLYVELLRTFCPADGKVLDPIAGPLTTVLACIATKRSCLLLESDDHCLMQALPRLTAFAESKLWMDESHSTSSEGSFPSHQDSHETIDNESAIDGAFQSEETRAETENAALEYRGRSGSMKDNVMNIGKSRCFSVISSEEENFATPREAESIELKRAGDITRYNEMEQCKPKKRQKNLTVNVRQGSTN